MAEQERESGKRVKLQISTLEERLVAMDDQLQNESKERQNAIRQVRRLEKHAKEVSLQVCMTFWGWLTFSLLLYIFLSMIDFW